MDMTSPSTHRRRRVYIDPDLQKWLVVGLVALEVTLIGTTLVLLHQRLLDAIGGTLYRVHVVASEPLFAELLHAARTALAGFVVANVVALALAETLWQRHVNGVRCALGALIAAIARLDLSVAEPSEARHEVLALVATWRERERERLLALRERANRLAAELDAGGEPERVRERVRELRQLLPPTGATRV